MLKTAFLIAFILFPISTGPAMTVIISEFTDMDGYINKLAVYECRGCPSDFSKIDTDGERVYSCLQFKKSTFTEQVIKFDLLPEAEESDIMNMIYDCDFQKYLAKLMLEENPEFIWRWATSVKRGLGLPPNYE